MADETPEDKQKEMARRYEEVGNMEKVANEFETSTATVKKYAEKWDGKLEDEQEDESDEQAQIDFSAMGQTATEAQSGVDFGAMSPGDFVQWYFEEDLAEIDVDSIGLFARRCDSRQAIPTESKMRELLQGLPTGMGNDIQTGWIAEEYWRRSLEYLSAKLATEQGAIMEWISKNNFSWVRVTSSPGGPGGGGQTGGGVGTFQQQQQQNQPGGVGSPPQGQNQGQNVADPAALDTSDDATTQVMQQMLQEMRQERKQMMDMLSEQNQPQEPQQSSGMADQVKEIVEAQQALESLQGSDDDDMERVVQAFQQELEQIQRQINENDAPQQAQQDPIAAAMTNLTQRQDIDPQVIGEIATNVSSQNDPEVRKKEIDREIEQMKMRNRQETVEKVLDGLGEALNNVSGIAELAQSVNGQQQGQQQPTPAQHQNGHQQQPARAGNQRETEPEPEQADDFDIDGVIEESDVDEEDEESEPDVDEEGEAGEAVADGGEEDE